MHSNLQKHGPKQTAKMRHVSFHYTSSPTGPHQMPWPTTTYENPTMSTWPSLFRCYESVGPIGGEPVCWHIRNGEAAFLLDKRAQVKWVSANHWWTRFPRSTASVSPFTRCVSSGPPIFAYPIHYSHWKKVFQQHNFVFVYLFLILKKPCDHSLDRGVLVLY